MTARNFDASNLYFCLDAQETIVNNFAFGTKNNDFEKYKLVYKNIKPPE